MELIIIIAVLAVLAVCIMNHSKIGELRSELRDVRRILEERGIERTHVTPPATDNLSAPEYDNVESARQGVSAAQVPVMPPVPPVPPVPDMMVSDISEEEAPLQPRLTEESERKRSFNIEKLVGENIFSKIGILALVIGIGFFVKYAIDNDWINETARTVLGLLTGFGLWGIAYYLRDRYRNFSSVIAGGGFAVCFVTIAVAYNYYSLFSGTVTLGLFVILSAAMTFIALRFDRRELAMMAIIGGYIAPFLASGDSGNMTVLFSYTALLSAAMFVITLRRDWWELPIAGTIISWIIVGIACGRIPDSGSWTILGFSTLFFTIFSLPVATVMSRGRKNTPVFALLTILAIANPFAYIAVALRAVAGLAPLSGFHGIIPLYIALVNICLYYCFYRKNDDRLMQTVLLWIIVVFAALFVPVQFTTPSLLALSFSIYALLLAVVFAAGGRRLFAIASAVVTLVDIFYLVSLIFADEKRGMGMDVTLLFNGLCYLAMTVVIDRNWDKFGAIGHAVRYNLYGIAVNLGCALVSLSLEDMVSRSIVDSTSAMSVITSSLILLVAIFGRTGRYTSGFMPLLGLMMFVCFSYMESFETPLSHICHWSSAVILAAAIAVFARRVLMSDSRTSRIGNSVYYSLICSGLLIACILSALRNAGLSGYYSAGFSVGVIISGAILMVIGMRSRIKALRIVSLVFFGILLIKLVAYDLWQLPMLGRIIVFILLGGVLLSLSFLYQRLRARLFSDDAPGEE